MKDSRWGEATCNWWLHVRRDFPQWSRTQKFTSKRSDFLCPCLSHETIFFRHTAFILLIHTYWWTRGDARPTSRRGLQLWVPTPGNASKYLLLAQVNRTVANMLASCKHGEFGVNKCSRVNWLTFPRFHIGQEAVQLTELRQVTDGWPTVLALLLVNT